LYIATFVVTNYKNADTDTLLLVVVAFFYGDALVVAK
jgi:hypothetical protein